MFHQSLVLLFPLVALMMGAPASENNEIGTENFPTKATQWGPPSGHTKPWGGAARPSPQWGSPSVNTRPWGRSLTNTPTWGSPSMSTRPWPGHSVSKPWGTTTKTTQPWRQPYFGHNVQMLPMSYDTSGATSTNGNIEILPAHRAQQYNSMSGALPPVQPAALPYQQYQPGNGPVQPAAGPYNQVQSYQPGAGNSWYKSYTPLNRLENCYRQCTKRCGGYSQNYGCRPTCRPSCSTQPSCPPMAGMSSQYRGNTLYCGQGYNYGSYGNSYGNGYGNGYGNSYGNSYDLYQNLEDRLPYSTHTRNVVCAEGNCAEMHADDVTAVKSGDESSLGEEGSADFGEKE